MARKTRFDYFDAFERQADIALAEANLLIETIEGFTSADEIQRMMPKARELEHKGDDISHETYTAIAVDFITPFERDDILALSQALDDCIDDIEEVIREFYMMDIHFMHKDTIQLAVLIRKSCEALKLAVHEFSNFKKSAEFKKAIVEINSLEEDADDLYMELIHKLHTVDYDNPMRVLIWSRIFTKMEKCTDDAEHAADIMSTVMLKGA